MPATDKFGRHECLDRTALAVDFVAGHLIEHKGLKSDERKLAEQAHEILFELYQLIGKREL